MHNRRTTPQTVWIPGNSNDVFKLFWNGEGFVLMQCARLTISNTYLSLLRSCGEPLESQPLGNVLFHLDWLCWWKQTIFKTFLAVCGIPWAGPALLNSHLWCAGLQSQTTWAQNLALPLTNHLCLDKLLRLSEPQCLHLSNGDEYENLLYWSVMGICKYIANVSTELAPTNHSLNVHCSYYLGRPGV